jgi:hypothetical protein
MVCVCTIDPIGSQTEDGVVVHITVMAVPLADGLDSDELIDGCIAKWNKVKGSRRERATLYEGE